MEEFITISQDISDFVEYLILADKQPARGFHLRWVLNEKFKMLESLGRVLREITARTRRADITEHRDGRYVRADDPPHPWYLIRMDDAERSARVAIPASAEFAPYILAGVATDAQKSRFLDLQIERMHNFANALAPKIEAVNVALTDAPWLFAEAKHFLQLTRAAGELLREANRFSPPAAASSCGERLTIPSPDDGVSF